MTERRLFEPADVKTMTRFPLDTTADALTVACANLQATIAGYPERAPAIIALLADAQIAASCAAEHFDALEVRRFGVMHRPGAAGDPTGLYAAIGRAQAALLYHRAGNGDQTEITASLGVLTREIFAMADFYGLADFHAALDAKTAPAGKAH